MQPRCSQDLPSEALRTLRTYVRLKQKHKHPAGRRRRPPDRLRNPRRVRPRARRQAAPSCETRHRRPLPPDATSRRRRPGAPTLVLAAKPRRDAGTRSTALLLRPSRSRGPASRGSGAVTRAGFEEQARRRTRVAPRSSATQAADGARAPLIGRRARDHPARTSKKNRRRPTLPGGCPPSTIGAEWLNCSVRNGKRCFPLAMRHRNFARPPRWSLKTAQGLKSK